jgi:formate dehydrogenase subunit gamma
MLATGSIMRWYKPFPLAWRTGATFVHDWIAVLLFVLVVGHIVKALSEPDALQGMVTGSVDAGWARRRHPRWHRDDT